MNCEAYRAEILGRFAPADGARAACSAELQAHLDACAACAVFAGEHEHLVTLLGSLRAMQDSAPVQTVARIESNLLTAFRQQHSRIPAQASSRSCSEKVGGVPTSRFSESSALNERGHREILRMSRVPTLWTAAMAAMLLLAFGLFLRVSREPNLPTMPSPPRLTYLPRPPQDLSILGIHRGTEQPLRGSPDRAADSTEKTIASEKYLSVDNLESAENSANSEGHTQAQIDASSGHDSEAISTGGFIELTPGTPGFLAEGALVMRVRMPYAAVQYLGVATGLPYTQTAGAGGVVQADLLVGGDGTARAIRFVQ